MLAAGGQPHAEMVFQPGGRGVEIACRKYEVVRGGRA
jgi:hypothetical protein